jgi:monovalent cation/hydrogen antiporter
VGVGLGLLVGYLIQQIQRWIDEPVLAILVLVLGAYAAYLPAEALHGSGVLAVVATGLYVGRKVMPRLAASTRLTADAVLQMVTFLINGLVFILLGMQLSTVTAHIRGGELHHAFVIGLLVALTTVIVRFAWVFLVGGLGQLVPKRDSTVEPLSKRGFTVLAWSGMRGVVSLAVALAVPLVRDDGAPFPFREELVFAAFVAIVTTLLVQGLSLGPLIRKLGLAAEGDGEALARVRRASLEAAQRQLIALEARTDPAVLAEAQRIVEARAARIGRGPAPHDENALVLEELLREVVRAQRVTLDELRAEGKVADELLRRVERELDLDELRL